MGESTLVLNLPIIIGPGMNLHRHAYNSRGVEYYSEDPILSGYIGSAVVQGAQSKGCLVNIKHAAFNDQEINRSGIAVFMTEQRARELELRNLQQAFEANGKPVSFEADESRTDTYTTGALGVMTSYNRIGAVPSSANRGVMVNILRNEWGFKGYNVTDFTGVALKASPNAPIFCVNDYVCWSAPANDLSDWRCEGTIYCKNQDPKNRLGLRLLFAPDVTCGPDGRYYLYYAFDFMGIMGVAVCDTPAGRYRFLGHIHYADGTIWGRRKGDQFPFDPGVLTDDDGRVWLYSGFYTPVPAVVTGFQKLKNDGGTVLELEQDMVTIKTEPKVIFRKMALGPFPATSSSRPALFAKTEIDTSSSIPHATITSYAMPSATGRTAASPLVVHW